MKVLTIWNRLSSVVVFFLFVAGGLAVGLWYLPEIQRNQDLQTERLQIERQVAAAETYGHALRTRIAAFTNNPAAAERVIRERFGLARPGEWVVHFEPPSSNHPELRKP
jgi:cell division protein FtsB